MASAGAASPRVAVGNDDCSSPSAQIRTCGFPASGSCDCAAHGRRSCRHLPEGSLHPRRTARRGPELQRGERHAPPPLALNIALQRSQVLKGLRHGALRFHRHIRKRGSLFVLFLYTHSQKPAIIVGERCGLPQMRAQQGYDRSGCHFLSDEVSRGIRHFGSVSGQCGASGTHRPSYVAALPGSRVMPTPRQGLTFWSNKVLVCLRGISPLSAVSP
jgi:hypothetical protein